MEIPHSESRVILFYCNSDWFFVSHRLNLVIAAQQLGFEVHVASPKTKDFDALFSKMNITYHEVFISRSTTTIINEFKSIKHILKVLRKVNPNILHNITLKCVAFGSLSSLIVKKNINVVNAISGMGSSYLISKSSPYRRLPNIINLLNHFSNASIIVQNREDYELFSSSFPAVNPTSIFLILGSGFTDPGEPIDSAAFEESSNKGPIKLLFASRLLKDKGIREYIKAADHYCDSGSYQNCFKFFVAGSIDEGNPSSITLKDYNSYKSSSTVTFLGSFENISEVLPNFHVVVLPSYREGFPKILVEAMAFGKPIITTDVAGCRDAVSHGFNGFICESNNTESLVNAISLLPQSLSNLNVLGMNGYRFFRDNLSYKIINNKHTAIYNSLANQ